MKLKKIIASAIGAAIVQHPDNTGWYRSRCVVVTTDPTSAVRDAQALARLMGYDKNQLTAGLETRELVINDHGRQVSATIRFVSAAHGLRGMDLSSAFIDEYAEVSQSDLSIIRTRVGRYPSQFVPPLDGDLVRFVEFA